MKTQFGSIGDIFNNILPGMLLIALLWLALPADTLSAIPSLPDEVSIALPFQILLFVVLTFISGIVAQIATRIVPLRGSVSNVLDGVPITPRFYIISTRISGKVKDKYSWACYQLFTNESPTRKWRNGKKRMRVEPTGYRDDAVEYLRRKDVASIQRCDRLLDPVWTIELLFTGCLLLSTGAWMYEFIQLSVQSGPVWVSLGNEVPLIIAVSPFLLLIPLVLYPLLSIHNSIPLRITKTARGLFAISYFYILYIIIIGLCAWELDLPVLYESHAESLFGVGYGVITFLCLVACYVFHYSRQKLLYDSTLDRIEKLYAVALSEDDIDPIDSDIES